MKMLSLRLAAMFVGLLLVVSKGWAANVNGQVRLIAAGTNVCTSPLYCTDNIYLIPFGGTGIVINGTTYDVPPQWQLSLSNSGLSANTLYWIYVYNNSGTLTLEASTHPHTRSTTAGNAGTEVKCPSTSACTAGYDDTRSLVGLVETNANTQFEDDGQFRLVASWFNRRELYMAAPGIGNFSTKSTSWVDMGSNNHVSFVNWGSDNESFWVDFNGSGYSNKAGSNCQNVIAFVNSNGTQGTPQITAINGFWGPAAFYWTSIGQGSQMTGWNSTTYDGFFVVSIWFEVGDSSGATCGAEGVLSANVRG